MLSGSCYFGDEVNDAYDRGRDRTKTQRVWAVETENHTKQLCDKRHAPMSTEWKKHSFADIKVILMNLGE